MKKWIEFILLILGIGFISSLTFKFIKEMKSKTNENEVVEKTNYKHSMNISYVNLEELGLDLDLNLNFEIITDEEEEFDFDKLTNYISSHSIENNVEGYTIVAFITDASGKFNNADDIEYICFNPSAEGFVTIDDEDAHIGFTIANSNFETLYIPDRLVLSGHVNLTDTVTRTNDELTVSKTLNDVLNN